MRESTHQSTIRATTLSQLIQSYKLQRPSQQSSPRFNALSSSRHITLCREEGELAELFSAYGKVQHVRVLADRGVAYVKYDLASSAALAMEQLAAVGAVNDLGGCQRTLKISLASSVAPAPPAAQQADSASGGAGVVAAATGDPTGPSDGGGDGGGDGGDGDGDRESRGEHPGGAGAGGSVGGQHASTWDPEDDPPHSRQGGAG